MNIQQPTSNAQHPVMRRGANLQLSTCNFQPARAAGRALEGDRARRIIRLVEAFFGYGRGRLLVRCREWQFSHRRQMGMCLVRELTVLGSAEIGDLFGGYDHATVLYALGAVKDRCEVDGESARVFGQLRSWVVSGLASEPWPGSWPGGVVVLTVSQLGDYFYPLAAFAESVGKGDSARANVLAEALAQQSRGACRTGHGETGTESVSSAQSLDKRVDPLSFFEFCRWVFNPVGMGCGPDGRMNFQE